MIRRKQTNRLICSYATEAESLEAIFTMERFARNTHYEITINNIEKSFDPKDIFMIFTKIFSKNQLFRGFHNSLGLHFQSLTFKQKLMHHQKMSHYHLS